MARALRERRAARGRRAPFGRGRRSRRNLVASGALLLAACAGPYVEPEPPAPLAERAVPAKALPVPGVLFRVAGRPAFAIAPAAAARRSPLPWVLYAPTLPPYPDANEEWLFRELLAAGIAIAGVDVGESYGNAEGVAAFEALRTCLAAEGWSPRPVLLGRSRGGLQQLAYASAHPDRVAAFAGIYPVCDLASYPGLERAAPAYGLDAAGLAARLDELNPIARLAPLAGAGVPLFTIHGDVDGLVPLGPNSAALAERYRALGGAVQLVVAPGQGHNVWPGFFRAPELLAFLLAHAEGTSAPEPGDPRR